MNEGRGRFSPVVISQRIPTHNATVGDLTSSGRIDIVGKPFDPGKWVDVWWNS